MVTLKSIRTHLATALLAAAVLVPNQAKADIPYDCIEPLKVAAVAMQQLGEHTESLGGEIATLEPRRDGSLNGDDVLLVLGHVEATLRLAAISNLRWMEGINCIQPGLLDEPIAEMWRELE